MAENTKLNTVRFVIDTSALISFLLPDEISNQKIKEVFNSFVTEDYTFYAPHLLIYEVANVLKTAVVRGRVNAKDAKVIFEKFLNLPIIFLKVDYAKALELSLKYNLTFYDASYMQLAIQKKADLLTLDKRLTNLLKT